MKTPRKVAIVDKAGIVIKIFPDVFIAEKVTQAEKSAIYRCCEGKRKTAGGYRWIFLKDYTGMTLLNATAIFKSHIEYLTKAGLVYSEDLNPALEVILKHLETEL